MARGLHVSTLNALLETAAHLEGIAIKIKDCITKEVVTIEPPASKKPRPGSAVCLLVR